MDCLSPAHYEDDFQLDDLLDFPNEEEDDNDKEDENEPKNSLSHSRETHDKWSGSADQSIVPKASQNGSTSLLGTAKDGGMQEFTAFFQEACTSGMLCAPVMFVSVIDSNFHNKKKSVCVYTRETDARERKGRGRKEENGAVLPDDLVLQLEWLSAFNEDDSYTGDTALASLVSSGSLNIQMHNDEKPSVHDKFESSSPVSVLEESTVLPTNSYYTNVPSRARSKRSRNGGKIWSCDTVMPILLESNRQVSFIEESDFTSSMLWHHDDQQQQVKRTKPKRFHQKNPASVRDVSPPRRCSHCLVQKTPQWRAGPMGPKSLCNACGVRYKSGRLLPEYRPAGSPSFMSEIHSNSHKKVLEMRRFKEMERARAAPRRNSDIYGDPKAVGEDNLNDSEIEDVSTEKKKPVYGSPLQSCRSAACTIGEEHLEVGSWASIDDDTELQ